MSSTSVRTVHYSVNRLTVEFAATPQEFRSRYEQAVPPLPVEQVKALMERQAPWQEMLELITATAPLGFLIYHQVHGDVMRLAGDKAFCVAYLMGNHTIAERMFRYEPAVLLYAPLRTAWNHRRRRHGIMSLVEVHGIGLCSGRAPTAPICQG